MTEKSTNSKLGYAVMGKEWLLHEAVLSNETAVVRQILSDSNVFNVDCRNNYGRAPIHLAASRGNSEILKLLIEAKCDIEAKDKLEMRPLHMAALHGRREALELLLGAGAQATALDKNQRSLLMLAAQSSRHSNSGSSCVHRESQRLLEAEVKGDEEEEEMVLQLLNRLQSQAEMLEALSVQDVDGATALHHAARHGRSGPIESIGRKLGVEGLGRVLEIRDLQGRTALHEACEQGQRWAAGQLLALGADPLAQDSQGRSVLQLAAERRDSQICCWMLSSGLGPNQARALLQLSDARGYKLLHVVASLGCCVILQCLLDSELLTGPQLVEQMRTGCLEAGNSALHLAAGNGQLQAVELLLQHGAELELRNQLGQTPLELAEERGHAQVSRSLLLSEIEVDQQQQLSSRARTSSVTGRSLTNMASIVARTAHILYSLDHKTTKHD